MRLQDLGWDQWFAARFEPFGARGLRAARVAVGHPSQATVHTETGEEVVRVTGAPPVAGDWVAIEDGAVAAILERRTAFSRKVPLAKTEEQVLAANIDLAFVVESLAGDPNRRRIERHLTAAWQSGAEPVVLLTMADLNPEPERWRAEITAVAASAPVLLASCRSEDGLVEVRERLGRRRTAVLLGPSGVGKSTLINTLLGRDTMLTQEVRRDGKGRHTTSHRELIPIPGGGLLIDMPGIRELQLWHGAEGLKRAFADIEALVRQCRFADCAHGMEPGCAVRAAVTAGDLDPARLASYLKLGWELRSLAIREDSRPQAEERRRVRNLTRAMRPDARLRDDDDADD